MVSDSSRFSSRDTLVSVLWRKCWLLLGKSSFEAAAPDELRLDSHVEELAARRKIDRLVSYRFIQGISNQPRQLSDGREALRNCFGTTMTHRAVNFCRSSHQENFGLLRKIQPAISHKQQGVHNPILTGLKRSSWLLTTWAMKKTLVV